MDIQLPVLPPDFQYRQEYQSKTTLVIESNDIGFVTISLKFRCFCLGMSVHPEHSQSRSTQKYTGKGWIEHLVRDAINHLIDRR